jgi:hypothetical protein
LEPRWAATFNSSLAPGANTLMQRSRGRIMRLGWVDGSNKLVRNWTAGRDANSVATIASSPPIQPLEHFSTRETTRTAAHQHPCIIYQSSPPGSSYLPWPSSGFCPFANVVMCHYLAVVSNVVSLLIYNMFSLFCLVTSMHNAPVSQRSATGDKQQDDRRLLPPSPPYIQARRSIQCKFRGR